MAAASRRRASSCPRRSATSTSTCSISCCAAASIAGRACSTPAAATAATWSYLLRRGFTCFGIDRDPAADRARARARRAARAGSAAREFPRRRARSAALGRRQHGRRRLQRGAALRARPRALRSDGRGDVARARAGRDAVRAARVEHRHRDRPSAPPDAACACPTDPIASSWTRRCCSIGRERLGGQLLDPIKTTNVQQQRCMTTWCNQQTLCSIERHVFRCDTNCQYCT